MLTTNLTGHPQTRPIGTRVALYTNEQYSGEEYQSRVEDCTVAHCTTQSYSRPTFRRAHIDPGPWIPFADTSTPERIPMCLKRSPNWNSETHASYMTSTFNLEDGVEHTQLGNSSLLKYKLGHSSLGCNTNCSDCTYASYILQAARYFVYLGECNRAKMRRACDKWYRIYQRHAINKYNWRKTHSVYKRPFHRINSFSITKERLI